MVVTVELGSAIRMMTIRLRRRKPEESTSKSHKRRKKTGKSVEEADR